MPKPTHAEDHSVEAQAPHDHASATPNQPHSRRGFLKRLSQMGAALGLGIIGVAATSKPAHACTEYYFDYKTEYGSCGSCSEGGVNKRVRRRYRRQCRGCSGGIEICDAWELIERTCVQCA